MHLNDLFFGDCLLIFDKYSMANIIQNKFYGNILMNNVAFIYINYSQINCMSSNMIIGLALNLNLGTASSCYRHKLTDLTRIINNNSLNCWNGGLLNLNTNYTNGQMNYFIADKQQNVDSNIPLMLIKSTCIAENVSFFVEE